MENPLSLRNVLLLIILSLTSLGWQMSAVAAEAGAPKAAAEVSGAVNINKATAEEIAQALNGIGDKKAQDIVAYRDKNGPFKTLDDLRNVKGVGEKTLERNASKILF